MTYHGFGPTPTWVLLIDHDNVPFERIQLRSILEAWLSEIAKVVRPEGVHDLLVRSYGGWWQGTDQSASRAEAARAYAEQCPALLSLDGGYWRVRFEFADSLIYSNPGFDRLSHTFALRPASPLTLAAGTAGCDAESCEAPRLRKWTFRRRGCTKPGCTRKFGDLWLRGEQKQVDIHLAVDLLMLASRAESTTHLALASDDLDFMPVLAQAGIIRPNHATLTHVRFTSRSAYLDETLTGLGLRLLVLPPADARSEHGTG